jgi:putative sigma-54 modulation protein
MIKVTTSFKNMEHTDSLDKRIHEKSQRFGKYFTAEHPGEAKWVCFAKGRQQSAELNLVTAFGMFTASANSTSLYQAFDQVVNKIEKQLKKHQEKVKSKMHRGKTELIILDPEVAWGDRDDEFAA